MEYWQILRKKLGRQKVILPSAAAGIFKDDGILLVFHKGFQKWQVPGGLQDLNESITQTAAREVSEELNLDLKATELISVYSSSDWDLHFPNGDEIQQLLLFFKMSGQFNEHDIMLQNSEIAEFKFFSLDNLPENMLDCCRQKCIDAANYNGSIIFH